MELVDRSHLELSSERRQPRRHDLPEFCAFLRSARLERNISIDAVAAQTKIKRDFFWDLERNDLSKWPSNRFYRESYLRAYATALGLDPRDVIERYRRELADVEVPAAPVPVPATNITVPPMASRRVTPLTIPIIIGITFVLAYGIARSLSSAGTSESPAPAAAASAVVAPVVATPAESPVRQAVPESQPLAAADLENVEGELMITSTPPGAHVTVNGIGRGPTPVHVRYLPAGSHTVRFIRDGHSIVTKHVTISAERQRARVSVALDTARTN